SRSLSAHPLFSLSCISAPLPPRSPLFPYTTLFRSRFKRAAVRPRAVRGQHPARHRSAAPRQKLRERRETLLIGTAPAFGVPDEIDRKSTRLNSSHVKISYAVFCLKKKKQLTHQNIV